MTSRRTSPTNDARLTLGELRKRCEAQALPLTGPRLAVLETLVGLQGTHPTADEVYACARDRGFHIGRATVYRALEAFVARHVLTKAAHAGTAMRYDGTLARHHHLVCLRCNGILDVADERLDAIPLPDTSKLGFAISDLQIQVRGICRACQEREQADQP